MNEHSDTLDELNKHIPLHDKLVATHKSVSEIFPFIVRIAVAIYDPKTSVLTGGFLTGSITGCSAGKLGPTRNIYRKWR